MGWVRKAFGKYSCSIICSSESFCDKRNLFVLLISWENNVIWTFSSIDKKRCISHRVMSSSPRFSAQVAVKSTIFMDYRWWRLRIHHTVLSPTPVRFSGICSMRFSTVFLSYPMPTREVIIDWSRSEYILVFLRCFFWTLVILWRVSVSRDQRSSTMILLASFGPIPLACVRRFDSPLAMACITSFWPSSRRESAHFGPSPLTERSLLKIFLSSIVSKPMSREPASVWWWYIQSLRVSPRLFSPIVLDWTVTVYPTQFVRRVISLPSMSSSVPIMREIIGAL